MSMLVRHLDDNNDEALRPSDTARWKSQGSGSVQEAGGSEGRSCHLLLCSTQGPAESPHCCPFWVVGVPPTARSFPLPMSSSVVWFSLRDSRRQRARKPRAEYTVTATSNDRVNWPLKTPRWTKRDCRRGRANFQLLVDGQAGSSLLLVVRFCFGLLQPRSLAPLGNADKKVQAAWRRGEGTSWCCRLSEGGALPQLLVRAPSSPSRPSLMRWSRSTPDPASSQ